MCAEKCADTSTSESNEHNCDEIGKENSTTPFDSVFKLYKKKVPLSTLPPPLSFSSISPEWRQHIEVIKHKQDRDREGFHNKLGLKSPSMWHCYTLPTHCPGFIYVPNIFKEGHQYPWVWRALSEHHCLPNKCNVDLHTSRKEGGRLWKSSDWVGREWKREEVKIKMKENLMYQLRWTTVGYHYDWTHKVYREKERSTVPNDLEMLFKYLATTLQFEEFELEAGIINYYHLDSTLAGHIDQAEFNLDAPLFSLSFGQPAIFLIGGATKQTEPVPLLLQSGDLVVMGGPSRVAYHAVPRIVPQPQGDLTPAVCVLGKAAATELMEPLRHPAMFEETEAVMNYMDCSRINMNMRQVGKFPKN